MTKIPDRQYQQLSEQQCKEIMAKYQEMIDFYWTMLASMPFLEYYAVSLLDPDPPSDFYRETGSKMERKNETSISKEKDE